MSNNTQKQPKKSQKPEEPPFKFAFLDDYTPTNRMFNWLFFEDRIRAKIRHQSNFFVPFIAFIFFGFGWFFLMSEYFYLPFFARPGVILATGLPAAAGAFALWQWVSARVYPMIDRNPIPQKKIREAYVLPDLPKQSDYPEPYIVLGEEHPTRKYSSDGSYTEIFDTAEHYSAAPEWSILPFKSLATGTMVFGSIGSGKTSYFLRPAVFKIFDHPCRVGGLVMDSKGSLVEPLMLELKQFGRADDVLPVGPNHQTRFNPLYQPSESPETITENLVKVLENVRGSKFSGEAGWIKNGVVDILKSAIGLIRLQKNGYVCAFSVQYFLTQIQVQCGSQENPAQATKDYITEGIWSSKFDDMQKSEFEAYCSLIVARMTEDPRYRGTYFSEVGNILNPLLIPSLKYKFNAPLEELDMPSWVYVINQGKVIVLDCNSEKHPGLAEVLGTFLKLGYQTSILQRPDLERAGLVDSTKITALIIDEYQDFASHKDGIYLAKCRESKSMTFFATQGNASIEGAVGKEDANIIFNSLSNLLFFKQNMGAWGSEFLGKKEEEDRQKNITESIENAQMQSTGRFGGRGTVQESITVSTKQKERVTSVTLEELPTGQGILRSGDGMRPFPLKRIYCRPYFAPHDNHYCTNRIKNRSQR